MPIDCLMHVIFIAYNVTFSIGVEEETEALNQQDVRSVSWN